MCHMVFDATLLVDTQEYRVLNAWGEEKVRSVFFRVVDRQEVFQVDLKVVCSCEMLWLFFCFDRYFLIGIDSVVVVVVFQYYLYTHY